MHKCIVCQSAKETCYAVPTRNMRTFYWYCEDCIRDGKEPEASLFTEEMAPYGPAFPIPNREIVSTMAVTIGH
jgi:hypothetical protein